MGQALYRKYRSRKLSEIVGQEHITTTLNNALKNDQLSHAYLFTGPRGVGKTSVARILAHEINDLPYEDDSSHLDIIEIDAASNRKIDEIRQLRDRVNLAPTSSKYKVYIIDEVHMLTREAFNALLKTLEEPPAHVIFILATTEANKVPETISSRTQQFNFRPIAANQMSSQLRSIAKTEKIDIDDAALEIIAENGQGSFRDSISLLDQVSSSGKKVSTADLESLLGMAPTELVRSIILAIESGSPRELVGLLSEIQEKGYSITVICRQLLIELRNIIIVGGAKIDPTKVLSLMKELVDTPTSLDPSTSLEIALMTMVIENTQPTATLTPPNTSTNEPAAPIVKAEPKNPAEVNNSDAEITSKIISKKKSKTGDAGSDKDSNTRIWQAVLDQLKANYNTLYGIARMAIPDFGDGELVLRTKFSFHEKSLNQTKNKEIISNILREITGRKITVNCIVDKEISYLEDAPKVEPSAVSTISNIFGGAEVIE